MQYGVNIGQEQLLAAEVLETFGWNAENDYVVAAKILRITE
jgi:hypothetical protein